MKDPPPYFRLTVVLVYLVLISSGMDSLEAGVQKGTIFRYYATNPRSNRVKRATTVDVPPIRRDGELRETPYTKEEKDEILDKHNELRSKAKAADMLTMEWDSDLEAEAQRWADLCDFEHPTATRNIGTFKGLGQNLYVGTHEPKNASDPIQSWYDEIEDYTYSAIGDEGECKPNKMCGHYTQVVWAKSYAVGCAIADCDPLTSVSSFNKGHLVVCEYGPPGNVMTRHPYMKGEVCSKCPEEYTFCVKNRCSKVEGPPEENATSFNPPTTMLIVFVGLVAIFLGNWRGISAV